MPRIMTKNTIYKGAALLVAVIGLASIRFFESILFYDPLLTYFKGDYRANPLPEMNIVKWSLSTFFRFLLNTIVSLGLIWVLFKNWEIVKFLSIVYGLVLLVCMTVLWVLFFIDQPSNMLIFYTRRFLIQPILLMLFIPAVYFHLRVVSKK